MAKIGDICEILDSKRVPITATERQPGPYPYYGANGVQDYVADYIFDDDLVLLAEDGGNFGSKDKPIAYKVSGKCWVNNHAHVLKPKEGLDVDYLCYSLMFYDVTGLVNGATRQKLTQADMRKMEIPVPPLAEQRKIAAVLDKVSDLIAKRRQQLDKLDELVKARFVELLGLEKAAQNAEPLENFLENITYGFTNPMPDAEEGPWKITAKDIIDGKINFLTARKTTTEAFDALTEKSRPIIGDVLLTKDGTLGRMAIVEDTNICVNQSVAVLRCNKRVVPKILMYLLQMPEYQRDMISNAGGGTIKHIYITKVNKMQVAVPSMETQKKLLAFLGKIEKIKTTISHSLEQLETLKKALMQEYFG